MAATLTVIWWRDIPAQVIARDGERTHKIVLHGRFQVAIDKAAVKAGRREMDDYIAEWRKVQRRCGDDLETEAQAEVDRLEARYTRHLLAQLIAAGGVATADDVATADGVAPGGVTAGGAAAEEEGA